jgi:predicted transcriptional regulator
VWHAYAFQGPNAACKGQKAGFVLAFQPGEYGLFVFLLYNNVPSQVIYSKRLVRTMKYRSRTEIASHILEVANGGATKTKIMYRAFLSYAQLKEYLAMLTANDLLSYESSVYRTTGKGLRFLDATRKMDGMFDLDNTEEIAVKPGK